MLLALLQSEKLAPTLLVVGLLGCAALRVAWSLWRDPVAVAQVDGFYERHSERIRSVESRSGVRLALLEANEPTSGRPGLLFIHGSCARMGQFADQIEHFIDAGYHVAAFDAVGCGRSDKPRSAHHYEPERFVEDAASVVEEVFGATGERQVVLVGHSFGTYVALRNSALPAVVSSVLLGANPLWLDKALEKKLGIFHIPDALLWVLRPLFGAQFQKMAFAPAAPRALRKMEAEASSRNPVFMFAHFWRAVHRVQDGPHPSPPLKHPMLFISGRHDKLTPHARTAAYVDAEFHGRDHVQHVLVEDAGHQMMQEQSSRVISLIEKHIRSCH